MKKKGKEFVKTFIFYGLKIITILTAVSIFSFLLVKASPIDPVKQYLMGLGTAMSMEQRAKIEDYWGVDEPPVEQYLSWVREILQGNLGESSIYRRPVVDIIGERFMNSLVLMISAWILSGILGFLLGIVMGKCQDRWPDRILRYLCYIFSSLPTFWLGLLLLLIFSVWLGWFPIGFSSPIGLVGDKVTIGQKIYHLILPAFTLSLISFGNIALSTRQKLIDVMNSEYVLFARARGEGEWQILWYHGLRNTILPAITLQFTSFAELFGGSVLAENVFSYPGLGSAVSAAGLQSDLSLLLGITLFSTLFVCVGNTFADLILKRIDPKIGEVTQ